MRSLPFLALMGVLSVLLIACPAAGPSFTFTGTYSAPAKTATLTQAGTSVSGTYVDGTTLGPISAVLTVPGEATGTWTIPGVTLPLNLFLTAQQDLVIFFPSLGPSHAVFLERQ